MLILAVRVDRLQMRRGCGVDASMGSGIAMKVSIIIRTKNEEEWIERTLYAVTNQDYDDKEIIVVDSGSTDATIQKAQQFPIKMIEYSGPYFPGRALNLGTENSVGGLICYLSAHCIPTNDKWLERLLVRFDSPNIAGVYGRQIPLPDSSDFDKRDLWTVFGPESMVQEKNFFFHNANSMIRRDLWLERKFSNNLASLEDQEWAKQMINRGHKIIYEANACVHHFHGLHQGIDHERAARVVKVIDLLDDD